MRLTRRVGQNLDKSPGYAHSCRRWMAVFFIIAAACGGCRIERILWLIGDSTAQGDLLPALHQEALIQHRDLVIPVAAIGGAALGRDLAAFVVRVRSAVERGIPADAVVVSLGTNDLANAYVLPTGLAVPECWASIDTPEERRAAIDALLGALPAVPVLWIMPHAPVHDRAPFAEREMAFQASLIEAQARWPKLSLLDAQPEWYQGSDADTVHFTREGEQLAARAVLDGLARRLP